MMMKIWESDGLHSASKEGLPETGGLLFADGRFIIFVLGRTRLSEPASSPCLNDFNSESNAADGLIFRARNGLWGATWVAG